MNKRWSGQTQLCLNSLALKDSSFFNWSTLWNCCEIRRRVAEQIVMSPLGSCNKVIFLLHFAWPEGLPLSPVCSPHISLPLSGAVLGCRFCLAAARECCMIALGSACFLWTALQQENNISQASLNAHTFGNYRPVIRDEGREWGDQNEQFYGSRLFTSNERAIIARIRKRSASWEEKTCRPSWALSVPESLHLS